ncbi:serine/threonine-protein kinase pim-3-like [Oratosquilla oratoria]|uniref:serine/threonine-protein kinase pim-3-like n=1 Tax=Oratosquilla oratoria TaxID=337810 RepID=UPI003F76C759
MNKSEYTKLRARFEVQEPLGEGGYGCVYLAKDLARGTQVAMKKVPLSSVDTWGWREGTRVPMEASLLHKVQTVPGVIELYECFVTDGNFYMAMELMPKGTSIYDYMEKCGKLPIPQIKRLFCDIVRTVQRCLNAGVSHKDIKPENVLLYEDPGSGELKIKLIDFGCGETITGYMGTDTGGTTLYWPPEFIVDGEFLHVPATVWSLGTLLYYLVCHDDPFYDESEIEKGRPPFPEDLPRQCRDLMTKCFAMNPWERPSLHGILAHPWLKGFGLSEDGKELEPPDPKLFPPQILRKLEEREMKQNPQAPVNNTKRGLQEGSKKEIWVYVYLRKKVIKGIYWAQESNKDFQQKSIRQRAQPEVSTLH